VATKMKIEQEWKWKSQSTYKVFKLKPIYWYTLRTSDDKWMVEYSCESHEHAKKKALITAQEGKQFFFQGNIEECPYPRRVVRVWIDEMRIDYRDEIPQNLTDTVYGIKNTNKDTCECGAEKCGTTHSTWCPKFSK
jgi:hypothetical protein